MFNEQLPESIWYVKLVQESWLIEGVDPEPYVMRLACCHEKFVNKGNISVESLTEAALEFTGGEGRLRDRPGMNVIVGNHRPMQGGPNVIEVLENLCLDARELSPFELHQRFEHLHPFCDGNGRVGRMLWAWSMDHHDLEWGHLGFLHTWYYQSLSGWRK